MAVAASACGVAGSVGQYAGRFGRASLVERESVRRYDDGHAEGAASALLTSVAMAEITGQRLFREPVSQLAAIAAAQSRYKRKHRNFQPFTAWTGAVASSHSEVSRHDVGVMGDLSRGTVQGDPPAFEHVGIIGNFQRGLRVLLDQQDRASLLL